MPHDLNTLETECLVIGGGPAGLTAAVYLARFHRKVLVIDAGESRSNYIASSHNYPGAPDGISGPKLLRNLHEQAAKYGATICEGRITSIVKNGDVFEAQWEGGTIKARKVLLATGIVDETPNLPSMGEFIYNGAIRFCPICDAYEATDKVIGIMGPMKRIIKKACFISAYTPNIVMLPTEDVSIALDDDDKERMKTCGLTMPTKRLKDLIAIDQTVKAVLDDGEEIALDVLYPALGDNPRTELAVSLGATHNENDCIYADAHQQTSIEGFYVAGDLTTDLSQISVAVGQAAIAATHMHNTLPPNPRHTKTVQFS